MAENSMNLILEMLAIDQDHIYTKETRFQKLSLEVIGL